MTHDAKSQSILARYAAGEREFPNLDRDDGFYDFCGSDLRGAVFSGSHFFATFENANLEGADFSDCNVKTCVFTGAKLANATFFGAAIDAADFGSADLTGTNFENASAFGHVYGKGDVPIR